MFVDPFSALCYCYTVSKLLLHVHWECDAIIWLGCGMFGTLLKSTAHVFYMLLKYLSNIMHIKKNLKLFLIKTSQLS